MSAARLIRGSILSFGLDGGHLFEERGALAVSAEGRILWRGAWGDLPRAYVAAPIDDHGVSIVMPGFIDPHIHFPQYRILAAPGRDLLDWLQRFTYPEESRYGDRHHAEKAATIFLNRIFAAGTTAILAFCSVHRLCAEILFAAAESTGMAILTGKTMMDRNAIPELHDDPETGARDSEELIARWHGRGRARYAVSPRFAITSSETQLALAGELMKRHSQVYLQTHLSESRVELDAVRRLFPNDRDYTAVYERFGLLGPKSLFAHGIHLSERECLRLHESGSKIVHCPTSNTFLGSGLFPWAHLRKSGRELAVGLATDVGGGTSYSMLATMAEAYKVAMLQGVRLSSLELFRMATSGNAEALELRDEIGSLDEGAFADLVVLDPQATPLLASRHELSRSLEDVLFALMMLGDERAVRATYVAGRAVFSNKGLQA
jgi:guanine deaminase